jgi:putative transposase
VYRIINNLTIYKLVVLMGLSGRMQPMRTGRPRKPIVLSEEGTLELNAIAGSRSLPYGLVTRAKIVLMSAEGLSNRDIAAKVDYSTQSVALWRKRYREQGIAGLHDELRPGRPRSIADEQVAELVRNTLQSKPQGRTHWSVRSMAKESAVSAPTVQRIWQAFGLQPHQQGHFKISPAPFFVEKVRDIVGLYLNPPENAMVLCVDEKSQIQALDRTQPVLPLGLDYVEGVTHDYVRHGTLTLFAALDIASGKVLTKCKKRHRHQEYLDFLKHIEANVPPELDAHLVVDNYATHRHARVRRWLALHHRFYVHLTPTYASRLNQVEIWFNVIIQQAIRRGTFRSVKDMAAKIDHFARHHNAQA